MDLCSKNASLHKRRYQFRIGFYSVFCLSDTFLGLLFACIFDQKTYQKPFQNEVRTLQKSLPKICYFSTLIFLGLGLDFGSSGTSSWSQVGHFGLQNPRMVSSKSHLKLDVFRKWRLGGLWAQFGSPKTPPFSASICAYN